MSFSEPTVCECGSPDGREFPAELVGLDAPSDIALLKTHATHLPQLRWGSSSRVRVGDPVVVIGNPFGVGQTATAGILSARGRALAGSPYIEFLTDGRGDQPRKFGGTDAIHGWPRYRGCINDADAERRVYRTGLRNSGRDRRDGGPSLACTRTRRPRVPRDICAGFDRGTCQSVACEFLRLRAGDSSRAIGPAAQALMLGDVITKIDAAPITAP